MPEHDDVGTPNTGRMLSAIESWKVYPNPAAFQLISESLSKLALPVEKWQAGLDQLVLIAIDRKGQRVAASNGRKIAILRRDGAPVSPGLETEGGVVKMIFADAEKELPVLTATWNRRGSTRVVGQFSAASFQFGEGRSTLCLLKTRSRARTSEPTVGRTGPPAALPTSRTAGSRGGARRGLSPV